ncbi:protein singed wings 2 [Diorhabda carinulata]|uniref:protein singed wings 2 n=1 Tax=Diorhabda carinulata TaxID=1163345 RepID=UPI0025A0AA22|nr:protein singed wings 2 [Diorhabda carinulata]XP_057660032.1 protein singed wings 2 [Diorhabda carinulata]XP_057660033.1 protein singed wings 2 [Diorhabda carinulata]XP_057660034.1 protein singed wings 2 [Diorhabda carinulata]XP_057660035.1 protein singed wings 2 [Diorhabda carinulata]
MELKYIFSCYLYLIIQLVFVTAKYNNNCRILLDELKCFGNIVDFGGNAKYIKQLKLLDMTSNTLDFDFILDKYPNLEYLFIENGEISTISPPKKNNSIKVLVLRNLRIERISQDFVLFFPYLEVLNLEQNLLSELSNEFHTGNLNELYIENNHWNCSKDVKWALHLNTTGVARDLIKTTCKDKLYSKKSVLLIAQFKKDMEKTCTPTCMCSLERIFIDPNSNIQYPIIMVNCSGRNFSDLPGQLPAYTRILHLENNNIDNIKSLTTNPYYGQVWDLYVDNNSIESISYLEGSYWISHFRIFSIRGNKLRELPSYALDNALMKNPNMPSGVTLFLGGNPWKCDCAFTPVFQELVLQKYSIQIRDLEDVKCSYIRGDENSLKPINNLSRSSVCIASTDFSLQEGLDLLNAVLASLIIFILGKLAYDYYHFKKSGKLPWIVSKIP